MTSTKPPAAHAPTDRPYSKMAATAVYVLLFVSVLTTKVLASDELQEFYQQINEIVKAGTEDNLPQHPVQVPGWPREPDQVGQVTGVAINNYHQPVIFHRGPRVWDETSFNQTNHFQHTKEGPIKVDTVLTLDPETGDVVSSWGSHMFYMPHGLTIDKHGYYYLTDVALHQVFKMRPGHKKPILEFGRRFQPGSGLRHLCQPTDVAVASSGDIFIADGYCNSRVLKFSVNGNLVGIIPQSQQFLSLMVPHSLTLLEEHDLVCIADRENMRVVCPRAGLEGPVPDPRAVLTIQQPDLGRVFAVTSHNGHVYAVNGPTVSNIIAVQGFTIDPLSETVVDEWSPRGGFSGPHDIDICHNTSAIYITETGPNRIWKFQLQRTNTH